MCVRVCVCVCLPVPAAMERLRQSLPTCSPAACCEAEALDDPLDGGVVSELNYGNWMSDVANRLWIIPLVRHPLRVAGP